MFNTLFKNFDNSSPYSDFCVFFSFSPWRALVNLSCTVGRGWGVTSLSFFAQELAFAPPYLKDSVVRYAILGWQMLSLNTLNMLFHCILACTVSAESLVKEVPCKVLSHFSWLPFKFLVIDFPDFHFNVSGRRWPFVFEIRCIISFVDVYIQVLLYILHVLSYYFFK